MPTTAPVPVATMLALVLLTMFAPGRQAMAEVYRCTNAAGATEFSDAPCGKGSQGAKIDVRPNTLDTSGAREQNLKAENQRLQNALDAQQGSAKAGPAAEAPRIDSFACKQARRDYEVAASSIDKAPALLRARQSAMYGACGMREPDQQTTNIRIQNGPNRSAGPRGALSPASAPRP